ncbi:MAG: hypothetical protein ACTHN4_00860 [Sphingomicrobium sp.]
MHQELADVVLIPNLPWIIGGSLLLGFMAIGGWVFTTWLRIKHGYPLETSWGRPIHPQVSNEAKERIKLLTNENAELRAEIGSLKDRLGTVERIITDQPSSLARDIDALVDKGGRA